MQAINSSHTTRLRAERGQTTVFFVVAFMTLFMFLAFVVNLGQAVNRRVMLQMIADAGAWTGAARQAQYLNSMSDLNDAEKNYVYTPAQILSGYFSVTVEPLGGLAKVLWDVGNNLYKIWFKYRFNQLGNQQAVKAAIDVTEKNAAQLFKGEKLEHVSSSFPYLAAELMDVKAVQKMAGASTQYVAIYWIGVNTYQVDLSEVWYIANDNHKIVNFFWWVRAPGVGGPVFPSLFKIPSMTAVALAKPTGGSLDPEDSGGAHGDGYKVRMIPVDYLKKSDYRSYTATMLTLAQMGGSMGDLMSGLYNPMGKIRH